MVFRAVKNRLAKKAAKGVAPKSLLSNIQLLRLNNFKKLIKSVRLALLIVVAISLLGYQPVIGFPPLQKAVANAEERAQLIQEATIDAGGFAHPFTLPHPGYLSTTFSSWHPGIDIAVGLGTPIHPISEGKVVEINYGFFGLGNYVVIEHEQGIKSVYGHMGRVFTKVDELVTPDSTIGLVGLTGKTSGPHTHLEVTKDGKYINPQGILPKVAPMPFMAYSSTNSAKVANPVGGGPVVNAKR